MTTIPIPLNGMFDSKTLELADRLQEAKRGDEFKLCLYETGTVVVDAALAFYDVVQTRPKGISVHIHSHVYLMGGDVLICRLATREQFEGMRGFISGNIPGTGYKSRKCKN